MTRKRKISRRPTKKHFKEHHIDGKDSIERWREVFVETADITEYEAALKLCGTWTEWCRFKKEWAHFRETILPAWLEEVEVLIRSRAIRKITNSEDTASAKWVAEGKWKERKAGRTPAKVAAQTKRVEMTIEENEVQRVLDAVSQRKPKLKTTGS